ncbi:hypothetical protein K440DRAFT_641698 [Wilcoxina mikolae CBS 423.85]|nr:hypothetical protein K440DRAFT_641698 [Wilcoxina mikolae CBS 423.85]
MSSPPLLRSALVSHITPILSSPRASFPLLYHLPTSPSDPILTTILLSISPTPSVYTHLHTHPPELLFLHHPWRLDLTLIPPTTLVLASHEGFDDALTTGYNPMLATALGVTWPYECIHGYKGDSERRIGLVGWMLGVGVEEFVGRVEREFRGVDEVVMVEEGLVGTVACLGAFSKEVVDRVVEMGEGVVVVTGQRREEGIKRARERGVSAVVCVGHKRSEQWGVRWLKEEVGRWSEGRVEAVVVEEEGGE